MANCSLEKSETKKKIQKMGRLDLNHLKSMKKYITNILIK